jgi:hypothetical protein
MKTLAQYIQNFFLDVLLDHLQILIRYNVSK